MRTNLDLYKLSKIALISKEIIEWVVNKDNPEHYSNVANLESVRDFVHTLDLLETTLTHFGIISHLANITLTQLEYPILEGSLGWEFWQVDLEEFFASILLESCYQLSNEWKKIQEFGKKEPSFRILSCTHKEPSKKVLIARHTVTHPKPQEFENHPISDYYSILRRPYKIVDGKLEKELAKYTMPKIANLIQGAVNEALNYISLFQKATIGISPK